MLPSRDAAVTVTACWPHATGLATGWSVPGTLRLTRSDPSPRRLNAATLNSNPGRYRASLCWRGLRTPPPPLPLPLPRRGKGEGEREGRGRRGIGGTKRRRHEGPGRLAAPTGVVVAGVVSRRRAGRPIAALISAAHRGGVFRVAECRPIAAVTWRRHGGLRRPVGSGSRLRAGRFGLRASVLCCWVAV
jgi:hypothetical protein